MPDCTSAATGLPFGSIAYGPQASAVATSVPARRPRGTVNRDAGWPAAVMAAGVARRERMLVLTAGAAGGKSPPARLNNMLMLIQLC